MSKPKIGKKFYAPNGGVWIRPVDEALAAAQPASCSDALWVDPEGSFLGNSERKGPEQTMKEKGKR